MIKNITFFYPSGGFGLETYSIPNDSQNMQSDMNEHIVFCLNEILDTTQPIKEPGQPIIENYESYILGEFNNDISKYIMYLIKEKKIPKGKPIPSIKTIKTEYIKIETEKKPVSSIKPIQTKYIKIATV